MQRTSGTSDIQITSGKRQSAFLYHPGRPVYRQPFKLLAAGSSTRFAHIPKAPSRQPRFWHAAVFTTKKRQPVLTVINALSRQQRWAGSGAAGSACHNGTLIITNSPSVPTPPTWAAVVSLLTVLRRRSQSHHQSITTAGCTSGFLRCLVTLAQQHCANHTAPY